MVKILRWKADNKSKMIEIKQEDVQGTKKHLEGIESLLADLQSRIDETDTGNMKDLLVRETLLETRMWFRKERDDLKDFLWFAQDKLERSKDTR